ncbi:MAG: hypothetical protein AAF556_10100 [Pseudomonadota bacterium]
MSTEQPQTTPVVFLTSQLAWGRGLIGANIGGPRYLGQNGLDEVIEQLAKDFATEVLSDSSVDGKLGEYRQQLIEASQHQRQPRPGQAYEQHYAYEHHQDYASTQTYNQDPPNPFR